MEQHPSDGTAQAKSVFAAQRAAHLQERGPSSHAERIAHLRALKAALVRFEPQILTALAEDLGKSRSEALMTEILPIRQELKLAITSLKGWMRPKRKSGGLVGFGTRAEVRPEPRGICLILSPWNYPLNLALQPLVSCLSAGNRAVLKPSEHAPATARLIAELIADSFPPAQVAVALGDADLATALTALPFDHIFFTGSTEVGRKVMAAAAANLASVTLELGGKSPAIILEDADLVAAARWIVFGKFTNAGQTCIAPDHIRVAAPIRARFLEVLATEIRCAHGEVGRGMGRIIHEGHAKRLRAILAEAEAMGAARLLGRAGEGVVMPPVLLDGAPQGSRLAQDEVFGPLLAVEGFESLDALLGELRQGAKPLALYIFGCSSPEIERVIAASQSGSVGVNLTLLQFSHKGLPFGGVNQSGIGAAHGEWGFRAFSHERAILRNRFSPLPMIFAPMTAGKRRLIGWAAKLLG